MMELLASKSSKEAMMLPGPGQSLTANDSVLGAIVAYPLAHSSTSTIYLPHHDTSSTMLCGNKSEKRALLFQAHWLRKPSSR